jgi:hypothetical protein
MLQYVIVVDDEDRENEGDLIMAASKVTPEAMAFIVRHGTGIVCVSMKEDDLERLELPLMVVAKENEEKLRTAFTVSVVRCLNFYCFCSIKHLTHAAVCLNRTRHARKFYLYEEYAKAVTF